MFVKLPTWKHQNPLYLVTQGGWLLESLEGLVLQDRG